MTTDEARPLFPDVFTHDYARQMIEWYGLKEGQQGDVLVKFVAMHGDIPSYLHKEWHIGDLSIPVLYIKKQLWMSLSPMEIQSCEYALTQATGNVATAGLGMGYFTLLASVKDDVESIDVYEINPDVINFFIANFSEREGFEKINFILGDVREEMKDKKYDLVYNDIYQTMLPDEVITDIELLCNNNDIEKYIFWGYELVIWAASMQKVCIQDLHDIPFMLREYFASFMFDKERVEMSKQNWDLPEEEFIEKSIQFLLTYNKFGLP